MGLSLAVSCSANDFCTSLILEITSQILESRRAEEYVPAFQSLILGQQHFRSAEVPYRRRGIPRCFMTHRRLEKHLRDLGFPLGHLMLFRAE